MFEKNLKRIAVLDFGGQYAHLITKRFRELGVLAEIYNPETFLPNDSKIAGIVFSGGPKSVYGKDAYNITWNILDLKIPLLGICYGHQLIAHLYGGKVEEGPSKEYGPTIIRVTTPSQLFLKTADQFQVWMSHGDHVAKLPEGFTSTAISESVIVAFEGKSKNNSPVFGVQFHPEVFHSEFGSNILNNFLSVCQIEKNWKPASMSQNIIEDIRRKAQNKKLFLLVSGGVDSLVCLGLLIKAVGNERVVSLHVDTGFMRLNESTEIMNYLRTLGFDNLRIAQAEERFLKALDGVTEPEEKRNIIGKLFVDVLQDEIKILEKSELKENEWMLVQGTIYPDTIETGNKKAAKIKTHHNRVPEIERMIENGQVIEPLQMLYKDEVRAIGLELGLPADLINRHPFPGPGLAIRILTSGTDTPEKDFNHEEKKLNELISPYGFEGKILPIKSVGVQGDFRTYRHPAVIWPKSETQNLDWNAIRTCSTNVINHLATVNRLVFSLFPLKENVYLKKTTLTKDQADRLRSLDDYLMKSLKNISEIWQMPVVSLPLYDSTNRQIFLMRPVTSMDAMTADAYGMDFNLLKNLILKARQISNVADVWYDVTSKPPGTIEWE